VATENKKTTDASIRAASHGCEEVSTTTEREDDTKETLWHVRWDTKMVVTEAEKVVTAALGPEQQHEALASGIAFLTARLGAQWAALATDELQRRRRWRRTVASAMARATAKASAMAIFADAKIGPFSVCAVLYGDGTRLGVLALRAPLRSGVHVTPVRYP
jgi:hypothetical protein